MTDVTNDQAVNMNQQTPTIENYAIDIAEDTVKSLKGQWVVLLNDLLEKMGNTPENREWLNQRTAEIQVASFLTSYNAMQLSELFNFYINGGNEMDVGALFLMNDIIRGIRNHAAAFPQAYMNVYDPDLAGVDDPRWSYDNLPTERLMVNPGNVRIPVKIETFTELMYGYLELFAYNKQVDGKLVKIQTTLPAIRIKDNFVVPNAVFRWFEVDEDTVKNAWNTGRSKVTKDKSYITKQKDNNPIEDNTTTGVDENDPTTEP